MSFSLPDFPTFVDEAKKWPHDDWAISVINWFWSNHRTQTKEANLMLAMNVGDRNGHRVVFR
ncbi:MAG TPA: hypothetical protein QF564_11910, partial [Pirellulaceae bacterium]|nr:hypothetical protein [Pirellulaceae bacterium]